MPRGQQIIPDLITGMYVLRRARRSDGSPMGAIVHQEKGESLMRQNEVYKPLITLSQCH